jgi:outer membrane receptor for ferrienterochelin and colicins
MKKYIIFFFCHLFIMNLLAETPALGNTDANVIGHVIDKKTREHLPYVTISLKGTTIGTTTDATGHYFLKNLPKGKFTIEAKFVGYQTGQFEIEVTEKKTLEIDFELEETAISLNEVVVSSNRNETTRRLAPTLVSVLDVKTFERTNACTVADGLSFQPGLRVENNCQNCGFTQVRMNGLEGAYSQILIDSRPIFSALAGVYGLEQIPATMVERIEVVRGGGSALFGSSAIAGTINIITKEPLRNSAQLSHTITSIGGKGDFDNNTSFNASLVSDDHRMGIMAFGQKRHRSAYDDDGDGFTEVPTIDSRTLGFRSFIKTGTYSKITFEYHNMNEFRRGGDRLNEEPHNAYIAEQIESNIDGGNLKYDWFTPDYKHRFSVYTAAQLTKRKSYYGGGTPVNEIMTDAGLTEGEKLEEIEVRMNSYGRTKDVTYSIGGQYSYDFDKLLFMPSTLTAGLEYTSDDLEDKSGYRDNPIEQKVNTKSAFAQNEWKNEQWSFLVGGRLDKHKLLKNAIFSPRANVRYNPTKDINIRISYGQGFRAPQLFDEDLHVDLAGGDVILRQLDPNLKEEKSHSFSGSIDWYHQIGGTMLNFLVEGFYTKLNNPFTSISQEQPDGSTIKMIVNASGAKVYGVNLEAKAAYGNLLQFQLGATIQKSRYDEARKWSDDEDDSVKPEKRMMRTPDVYGYFVATVTPFKRFSTNLSGKYTGNMLVPYEGGGELNRTVKTSEFFELGWKVAYEIPFYKGTTFEINAGIQNIFNSYQDDFDKGPDRVSSYIYGPAMPRSYFAGAKLSF